ncbi:MAG: hypothetical protein CM15mP22_6070 [Gammaproteobacteria bacterium]|nr:MAG: hypothetical protein CM15mP22_6070 [Gammaproteobacteria bacterium]
MVYLFEDQETTWYSISWRRAWRRAWRRHEGEDEEKHGDEHEGERIFAFTESQAVKCVVVFKSMVFSEQCRFLFQRSDYSFRQHAEEGMKMKGMKNEGHEDEHGHEKGPTLFTNDAKVGAIFDLVP